MTPYLNNFTSGLQPAFEGRLETTPDPQNSCLTKVIIPESGVGRGTYSQAIEGPLLNLTDNV